MNRRFISIIYSPQSSLIQKIRGYLYSSSEVIDVPHINSLFLLLKQHSPAILFVDMTASQSEKLLEHINNTQPQVLIIAIGDERSDPILMAQTKDIFTTINPNFSKNQIQSTFQMASRHLDVIKECETLREELQKRREPQEKVIPNELLDRQASIHEVLQSFAQFDNIDNLLNQSLQWLRHEKYLGSVGIFLKNSEQKYYLKRALKAPQIVNDITFDSSDLLTTWLHYNPTALTITNVEEIGDQNTKKHLKKSLQALFAEVVLPLHDGEHLLGWIFLGKKATGKPLNNKDIIEISLIADQLGIVIEKCYLQQQIAQHKLYFENILNTLSASLILFDRDAEIIWWNHSAAALIDTLPKVVKRCHANHIHSELSGLITQACSYPYETSTLKWKKPQSNDQFLVESVPCFGAGKMQSGFLLIHDMASDTLFKQNHKKHEQTILASELAQKLSISIRSPLATIKTFIQLLPERSHDKEFQDIFIRLVSEEVKRLQNLSGEIQKMAHGQEILSGYLRMQDILRDSISHAITENNHKSISIMSSFDPEDVFVVGDHHSLVRCFSQMISGLIKLKSNTESALKISLLLSKESLAYPCCLVRLENLQESNHSAGSLRNNGHKYDTNLHEFSDIPQPNDIWHITELSFIKKVLANHAGTFKIGSQGKFKYITISLPIAKEETLIRERSELS